MSRTIALAIGLWGLLGAPPATAFTIKHATCTGHEFLSTEAARTVGAYYIPAKYHDSIALGTRYVDLGGMLLPQNYQLFGGKLAERIHENDASAHHHFTLRGGFGGAPKDRTQLIRDTTAWIHKLFFDARRISPEHTQWIADGGLLKVTQRLVYTKYFLLGAALHAVQDSFAHAYRTPTYGPVKHLLAGNNLKEWGGREGFKFAERGFYRTIHKVVLYPKHKPPETLEHNAVYKLEDGSPRWSDNIWTWKFGACALMRSHLGNFQPHAFGAYLASVEFLRAFVYGHGPWAFFRKWFRRARLPKGAREIIEPFPGRGNAMGRCPTAKCYYLWIPGESRPAAIPKWVSNPPPPSPIDASGAAAAAGSVGGALGALGSKSSGGASPAAPKSPGISQKAQDLLKALTTKGLPYLQSQAAGIWAAIKSLDCGRVVDSFSRLDPTSLILERVYKPAASCVAEIRKGFFCGIPDMIKTVIKGSVLAAWNHRKSCGLTALKTLTLAPATFLMCGLYHYLEPQVLKIARCFASLRRDSKFWKLLWDEAVKQACNVIGGLLLDVLLAAATGGAGLPKAIGSFVEKVGRALSPASWAGLKSVAGAKTFDAAVGYAQSVAKGLQDCR